MLFVYKREKNINRETVDNTWEGWEKNKYNLDKDRVKRKDYECRFAE